MKMWRTMGRITTVASTNIGVVFPSVGTGELIFLRRLLPPAFTAWAEQDLRFHVHTSKTLSEDGDLEVDWDRLEPLRDQPIENLD